MRLYSTTELARELSISVDYARRLVREKKIPAVKIGRNWKVKEEVIEKIKRGEINWLKE